MNETTEIFKYPVMYKQQKLKQLIFAKSSAKK